MSDKPTHAAQENDLPLDAIAAGALTELQAQLAELKAKNAELGEQYLRAQADMQNTRRRADEDMAKARKFAIESFAESLLPVCDSLQAGLAIHDASPAQIREGAEATLRQLKSALERSKVLEINPAGPSLPGPATPVASKSSGPGGRSPSYRTPSRVACTRSSPPRPFHPLPRPPLPPGNPSLKRCRAGSRTSQSKSPSMISNASRSSRVGFRCSVPG
jgi:hypothetical protein